MKTAYRFLLVSCCLVSSIFAQPAEESLARYVGIDSCRGCHTKPAGAYTTEFVLLDEASVWFAQDKHPDAFRIIAGVETLPSGSARINPQALGLTMLERLSQGKIPAERFTALARTGEQVNAELQAIDPQTAPELQAEQVRKLTRTYLNEAVALYLSAESNVGRGCLACHANLTSATTFNDPAVERSFREASIPDGVSCEACHGPSNLWKSPHEAKALERTHFLAAGLTANAENGLEKHWRELTAKQKQNFAMVEVRHAGVRAEQCFSCHIGDKPEGKFIPHNWYRAGHPPLPSIELSTFANAMPRHWRHYPEKGNFEKREVFLTVNNLQTKNYSALHDLPEAKAVVIGGLVALRKTLELLMEVRSEGQLFPDFAAYDCLACHQALRAAPVITKASYESEVPGRPYLSRWSLALAELSFTLDAADAPERLPAYQHAYAAVRAALSERPFGDSKQLKISGAALVKLLQEEEQVWVNRTLTAAHARRLAEQLQNLLETESLDFHTTRQLSWAWQRVTAEQTAPIPSHFRDTLGVEASLQYRQWQKNVRSTREQELSAAWQSPREMLSLTLPAGKQQSITQNLPQWLMRANAFTPQPFPEWFKSIEPAP